MDVAKRVLTVDGFEVRAGEVLEVRAAGNYQVGGTRTSPLGLRGASADFNMKGELFAKTPRGAGIALVGKHRLLAQLAVAPCGVLLARYAGPVTVGINDMQPNGAAGDISFEISARPPTAEEWKRAKTDQKCVVADTQVSGALPPAEAGPKWSESRAVLVREFLKANGEAIAQQIQQITHPSGSSPRLGGVRVDASGDDALQVRIESLWIGGIMRGKHSTTVLWELNSRRHVQAIVEKDTSNIAAAGPNKKQLDTWFEQSLYPKVSAP